MIGMAVLMAEGRTQRRHAVILATFRRMLEMIDTLRPRQQGQRQQNAVTKVRIAALDPDRCVVLSRHGRAILATARRRPVQGLLVSVDAPSAI